MDWMKLMKKDPVIISESYLRYSPHFDTIKKALLLAEKSVPEYDQYKVKEALDMLDELMDAVK
jgi:hypothetical protein|tara:strand:- start:175 stop:363 length:189 start_codon:yes stop_codon:yes gene_type:complete